ncbi:hypothetical protein IAT40_000651 [Kwoniella sp. CBS 6097]
MSSQSSYKSELRSTIYGVLHMIEANRTWSIPQYSNSLPALSTAPSSPLQAEAEEEPEDDPLPGRISFDSPRVANLHAHRKPPSGNQEGDVFTPRFQPLAWLEENRRQFIVRVAKLPSGQQSQVGGYEEVAKYAIVGELGKGGEGRCFLLQSCPGVEPVQKLAMKVPFKDPSMEPPGVNTLREIAVSRWLADDRVPREYKDVFPSHHLVHALNQGLQYAIFMDYMPGGALAEELWRQKSRDDRGPSPFGYLKEEVEEEVEEGRGEGCESGEGKYSLQQRVERCIELVRKVEVMHRCLSDMFGETMFNTDIKSDNILIDENGALRLADLGMVQPWRQLGAGDLRGGTWPYLPMDFLLILKNKSPGGILPSDLLFKAMPQFIAHSFGDLDMDFYIWTLGAVMLTIIHPALLMTQWHKSGGGDDLKRSMFARLRMHEDLKHYLETQLNLPLQGQSPVAERALKIIQGCFDVPGHRPSEVKLIDEFTKASADANANATIPSWSCTAGTRNPFDPQNQTQGQQPCLKSIQATLNTKGTASAKNQTEGCTGDLHPYQNSAHSQY